MPIGTKNTKIPGCGTHHIAIQTRDLEASLKLYRDVLGMTVAHEFVGGDRKILLLDVGDGSHLELFAPLPDMPQPLEQPLTITHFALTTSDAKAAIETVREAGYTVTVEPKRLHLGTLEVTIAFFSGPDGESVEFFQVH